MKLTQMSKEFRWTSGLSGTCQTIWVRTKKVKEIKINKNQTIPANVSNRQDKIKIYALQDAVLRRRNRPENNLLWLEGLDDGKQFFKRTKYSILSLVAL